MKKLLLIPLLSTLLFSEGSKDEYTAVKITTKVPYTMTTHAGQKIKIQRIQDTDNRLTDDYTKTSRACPPFCIQPTKRDEGIQNIEEVELLAFMQNEVSKNVGVVVDSRLKSWFELETIPSAVNIPYTIMQNASKAKAERIFKILGMKVKADGGWDFSNAKSLALFDNGVWCEQSKYLIEGLLKHNYPKEKLFYYRSGFQGWKLLGLTTIVQKEIKK
jgi:hypothetical protein